MKTSSLLVAGIQSPAWPMSAPSSTGVVRGRENFGTKAGVVGLDAEGGKMIMKARVPLFGDLTMASR